jgi:parallel beta-helix repeat protein
LEVRNGNCNLNSINYQGSFVEFIGGKFHTTVRNNCAGKFASGSGYAFYIGGSNNLVEGVKIYNIAGYGIHNYSNPSWPGANASNNVYRYNDVSATGQDTVVSFFAGILLGTGNNNQAYGNIVHDNIGAGIQIGNGATNSRVYNNTITGNKYSGGIVTGYQSGTIIANNILYNNTANFEIQVSSQPPVSYTNNLCGTSQTGCAVVASPLFVNPGANRYDLQPGSPAIDNGAILSDIPTVDIAGTPRPQGASWDIGAYEYK